MARKNVSASTVRAYLLSDEGQAALKAADVTTEVGSRGRHNPAQVAVFHKQNRGMRYEQATEAEKPQVEVPGVVLIDKAGRKTTKSVTITTEYARTLLGHDKGRVGRLPLGTLALALSAVEGEKVADTFA